jgi:hypothetical protein
MDLFPSAGEEGKTLSWVPYKGLTSVTVQPLSDLHSYLENTTLRKLDLFQFSDEERKTPTQLGPLGRANLNHWTTPVNPLGDLPPN